MKTKTYNHHNYHVSPSYQDLDKAENALIVFAVTLAVILLVLAYLAGAI
jgi:hypothetical protein